MQNASKEAEAGAMALEADPVYAELVQRSCDALGDYYDLQLEYSTPDDPWLYGHGNSELDAAWVAYKDAEAELKAYLAEHYPYLR